MTGPVTIGTRASPRRDATLLIAGQAVRAAGYGFAAVLLWRISANMPQLNDDGLPGFSANDWLAPVVTYVALSAYADLRAPADPRRFAQTRALATVAARVVNVVTI